MLIDALLVIIVLSGFFNGFRRGIIHSVFAFIALFIGTLLAMKYSYELSLWFYSRQITDSKLVPFVSFLLIFLAVLVVMKIFSRLIQSVADTLFLGTANKIAGGLLWAAVLLLVFSTVLWQLDQLHFISGQTKNASRTWPFITSLAPVVFEKISTVIPYFHGLFDSMQELFDKRSGPAQGVQAMLM